MFVTGGPPVRGGGGMPQRIRVISEPASVLRITGAGKSGNTLAEIFVARSDQMAPLEPSTLKPRAIVAALVAFRALRFYTATVNRVGLALRL
jgi:hypothetical protein